jgi:zinc protease
MLGGGTFTVTTFTKTDSSAEIISVALEELRKMQGKGPKPKELSTAQTYLAGLYPLRLETNESVGAAIAETRLYGLGDDWIPGYRDRVRAVTRARASEAAARYLPVDEPALVVVGNAARVKKMLAGFGQVDVRPIAEVE